MKGNSCFYVLSGGLGLRRMLEVIRSGNRDLSLLKKANWRLIF